MSPLSSALKLFQSALPPKLEGPFYGMKVVVAPHSVSPKLKLSDDCPVSDEFRESMDSWLVERFGYRTVCALKPGYAYISADLAILHPADYEKFKYAVGAAWPYNKEIEP